MLLLLAFAFLAGLATIASPCCLPILPALLSSAVGGRGRPLGIVAGFVATFVVATLAGAAAVQALAVPAAWLRIIAIVGLGLAGLALLLPAAGHRLERLLAPLARSVRPPRASGFLGGLPLGAALGLIWAPCVGPIMAAVIALAVTRGLSAAGAGITVASAAGAALPLLAIAAGARRLAAAPGRLTPHAEVSRRAFGGLTVLTALGLLSGLDSRLQRLVSTAPSTALTGFEQGAPVRRQLAALAGGPPAAAAATAHATTTAAPSAAASSAAPTTTRAAGGGGGEKRPV